MYAAIEDAGQGNAEGHDTADVHACGRALLRHMYVGFAALGPYIAVEDVKGAVA